MATSLATNQNYCIIVQGHLDSSWADWFDGMTFTQEPAGTTALTGSVTDQAALYRMLIKLRDLGLPLFSVNQLPQGEIS